MWHTIPCTQKLASVLLVNFPCLHCVAHSTLHTETGQCVAGIFPMFALCGTQYLAHRNWPVCCWYISHVCIVWHTVRCTQKLASVLLVIFPCVRHDHMRVSVGDSLRCIEKTVKKKKYRCAFSVTSIVIIQAFGL